jgi:hypothetical protein
MKSAEKLKDLSNNIEIIKPEKLENTIWIKNNLIKDSEKIIKEIIKEKKFLEIESHFNIKAKKDSSKSGNKLNSNSMIRRRRRKW